MSASATAAVPPRNEARVSDSGSDGGKPGIAPGGEERE